MDYTDKATAVRQGEELDAEKVEQFIKDEIPGLEGPLTIKQFPAGYSNLTYLLTIGNKELVLRRPPFGRKAKTAHDMGREYRIQKALRPVFPYCPQPLAYTEDTSIIGSPFYVMERIHGVILHREPPEGLKLTPGKVGQLCETLLDVLVELHSVDYKAVGLENFGKPQGYIRRQVEGWSGRYRNARTPDVPDCEKVMEWIAEKMPPDSDRPSIIHNDYRFNNVIFDEQNLSKIVGVLDWEMATVGDPLMDLGCTLAYWTQPDDPPGLIEISTSPTLLDGALTRDEILKRYAEKSGRSIETFDFYYCFNIFRLAVIVQQIYYRYYHKQTGDERFKDLFLAVHVLDQAARTVIEKSDL